MERALDNVSTTNTVICYDYMYKNRSIQSQTAFNSQQNLLGVQLKLNTVQLPAVCFRVSTWMDDRLWAGKQSWSPRSTQPGHPSVGRRNK